MKSKISVILVFLLTFPAFSQSDIRVLSSDRSSVVISYTPDYSDSSSLPINNEKFINIGLVDGYYPSDIKWGDPAVPERIVNVGVPSEFGNTIQVINSSFKEIRGKIIPMPTPAKSGRVNGNEYQLSDTYYSQNSNDKLVTFGKYGVTREVPTQGIIIYPVKVYPSQNRIKIYTNITFRITFSSNQIISSRPASDLLDGALVNYNMAKFWTVKKAGLKKATFNSVLATGKWIRFEAPEEGIYKITKSMLSDFGIDVNSVDPRTIKIYNNGGKVLPENFNLPRPSDLQENAIIVNGESDGSFDDNDYILFYGRGNNFWDYDQSTRTIKRYFHPYSNVNYYWLTYGGSQGKRIQSQQSLKTSAAYLQTSTKAFASLEEDKNKVAQTGREYYGDAFTTTSPTHTYTNKLDGRIATSPLRYNFRFVNASTDYIGLQLMENGTQIFNTNISGYPTGDNVYEVGRAYKFSTSYTGSLPDNRSVLKFNASFNSTTSNGYLDYFEIYYDRNLTAANDFLTFFSKDTTAIIEYDLNGFTSSDIHVFNVTDYANVKEITNPMVLSGSDFNFQASETGGRVSKYIAVGSGKYLSPENPQTISNSNLHGITQGAKFIIITDKAFDEAANRLKEYRENKSKEKISTIVVNIDQIFNEFSCGMVDVSAIRDFLKYAFDYWQVKPEYVLFFGKGTYDYKNIEGANNNFVPPYETQESLYEINSYVSDDFYTNVSGNSNYVDLASGRITVQSLDQANATVDKIIAYENDSEQGPWRNLITLVADDGYTGADHHYEGADHTAASETLANNDIPSSYNINKIYMAAYPEVITGSGFTMPTVNTAILNAINEGTLILNFVGHGSPTQWAQENVFNSSTSFSKINNENKLFFLTTATCDYGYYDKTDATSAAEDLIFMKNSGAIAAFTATRLVYSQLNHALMYQYYNDLLKSRRDSLNLNISVGKALFLTKQIYNGINDQKYLILGDPTLRILLPEYSANIDSINGQSLNAASSYVQIKALSDTKIYGQVVKPDSSYWNNFDGQGVLTIFDSQRTVLLDQLQNYPVIEQGGVIFRGRISVTGGKFSTNFVVPKDISYENKNGKVIFYFYGNNVDGLGFTNKIIVGGTDSTTVNDGKGPKIELFFDNTSYKNTYLVNPDSKLIVKLSDETGLNTTGTGVGHKFVGILNDREDNPIDFTNYFTSDLNSNGKSGEINYPFTNLASGDYKLQVKAWDVFNNFSTAETYFSVVTDSSLVIRDVYNYPNPFSSATTFTFQQNLNKLLDLRIKIYTVAGRLIREIKKYNVNQRFVRVDWDGRDQDGSQIANGTYLYKIIVRTTDGQFNKSVLGKLAVIR